MWRVAAAEAFPRARATTRRPDGRRAGAGSPEGCGRHAAGRSQKGRRCARIAAVTPPAVDVAVAIRDAALAKQDVWLGRWRARAWLWDNAHGHTPTGRVTPVRGCGRFTQVRVGDSGMDEPDTLRVERRVDGRVDVVGLRRCNSVWLCPVCSARIAQQRAEEVATAIREAARRGWGVAFVTLTLSHTVEDGLRESWDALQESLTGALGRVAWKRWCREHGVMMTGAKHRRVPMIRLVEVTVGARSGWHPHLHLIVFTEARETVAETRALHLDMMDVLLRGYRSELAKRGRRCVDPVRVDDQRSGGWSVDTIEGEDDERLGQYLAKSVYEGLGLEIAAPVHKQGRGEGRMTYFQLLARLASGGDKGPGCLRRLSWWREWEQVSKGRRQLVWSRGLKAELGVTEVDDDDIPEVDAVNPVVCDNAHSAVLYGPAECLAVLPRKTWDRWAMSGDWPDIMAALQRGKDLDPRWLLDPQAWRLWPLAELPS